MKPAPALDCSCCSRRIGKTSAHYLLDDNRVLCGRCLGKRRIHSVLFPACPVAWHDPQDHLQCSGTRAGIAHMLGLWPTANPNGGTKA